MDYSLIQSLVEAAYHKFKYEYPNEEPFFRITCTRKFGRSEKRNWRSTEDGTYPMRTVHKDGAESYNEIRPSGVRLDESQLVKNDDETKNRNESNRWASPVKTIPIKKSVVRDADKKIILTTKFNYDAMVDVRFDEPITVSTIKYFMNTTNGLLKELHEGYKVFLEDPTLWKGKEVFMFNPNTGSTFEERLDKAMLALREIDTKDVESKIERLEAITQTDAFTCLDCDDVLANLKTTFKSTLTIRDLAEKYISTEKKLNDLKSVVMPIMRHYKHLNLVKMMGEDGFIKTVGFLVDFLHTMDDDDYYDND